MRTKPTTHWKRLSDYAERDLALYRAFDAVRRHWTMAGHEFTTRELIEYVISHCRTRFFMCYDRAVRVARECRSSQITVGVSPLRQTMWREFLEQVEQHRASHSKATLHEAVAHVLAYGWASRFYISYHWAKHVIEGIRRLPYSERRRLLAARTDPQALRG